MSLYNNCCNKNVKRNQLPSSLGQSLPRPRSTIVFSITIVDPGNLFSSSSGLTVVAKGKGKHVGGNLKRCKRPRERKISATVNGSSTPRQPGSSDKQFEFWE
jgi:hypothetical protein